MRRLCAAVAALAAVGAGARAGASRQEAELLAQAGRAHYELAALRARDRDSRAASDLLQARALLSDARAIDPANATALAFLGLVRLDEARRPGSAFDAQALADARAVLEELFRLSRGWTDPATRATLRRVSGVLDAAAARDSGLRLWWESWRPGIETSLAAGPVAPGTAAALIDVLRTSPSARERQDALDELSRMEGVSPEAAEGLAEALRLDPSVRVRRAAAQALARARPAGWDLRLCEALRQDASSWIRWECARALADADAADEARAALGPALASDTPLVAAAAAQGLAALGKAEEVLLACMRAASSSLVRDACAGALRASGKDAALCGQLAALLDDPRPTVRAAAARALGPAGTEALAPERSARLRACLRDADPDVRAAAAGSLGAAAREELEARLLDEDPRVRLAAALSLKAVVPGHAGARAALGALATSCAPVRAGDGLGLSTVGRIAAEAVAGEGDR